MINHTNYINIAIKEAKKSLKTEDVPVGAIIVKDNKIISKGYNQKEKKQDVTRHAEIIAIEKACKKLKSWHLDGSTIYITMEPCMMCTGAIIQARIKNIVYSVKNEKTGYLESKNGKIFGNLKVISGLEKNKVECMLEEFFKKLR